MQYHEMENAARLQANESYPKRFQTTMKTATMVKMGALTACLVFVSFLPVVRGQERNQRLSMRSIYERGIQRPDLPIFLEATHSSSRADYFVDVILQIGKSNDPFWVPYLRPLLKKKPQPNNDFGGAAQLALAKLGEKEQLQEILCELDYGTALIQYDAIRDKLKYVGGWFSIRVIADRMRNDAKYRPLLRDFPGGDVVYGDPPTEALLVLPQVVPNPPDFKLPPPYEQSPEVQALRGSWLAWIDKHQVDLRQLAPVGDGVEASEKACRLVLKKDRAFDRSRIQH